MSPDFWRLMAWYCLVAFCGAVIGTVLMLMPVHGVELSISGNCSGIGSHVMEVEGVHLENMTVLGPAHNFNVSRDGLLTFENGSTWQILAGGRA